jgi:serine/threonine-protein kinase HipA
MCPSQLTSARDHRPVIVVERYDRVIRGRAVERIHQEDGCQVLGLAPQQKYPRGTGPREASLSRFAALLLARARDPIVELRRLLVQTSVERICRRKAAGVG